MEEICAKEGIEADPEVLSVLAQAGEGSVRDSLSALDQAIACCGLKLNASEVREMMGLFSLDLMGEVSAALAAEDSRRMLDLVLELERNGRSLQHFCRELARYFRNLLVAKVAGAKTKLIAASEREQARLAEVANGFSEEDLTRYLQLTLELFKDLQFSLQPRLHVEVGLLRLIHAGKMVAIEDAISDLGSGGSTPAPPRKSTPTPTTKNQEPTTKNQEPSTSHQPPATSHQPWRDRLHTALLEAGMQFTADGVEHSEVTESNGELQFVTPEEFRLAMNEKDILKIVQKIAGRPMRIKISFGTPAAVTTPIAKAKDDVEERALGHPDVKRFQEMFPDAQVRAVRNLKG
jgi:DNA polymerase-3 subunit gamma/tau